MREIRRAWMEYLRHPSGRWDLAFTLVWTVTVLQLFRPYMRWIEQRPGVVLEDPILMLFEPVDATWLTFLTLHFCLITGLTLLTRHPDRLLITCQGYGAMVVIRMMAMALIPLDPPPLMIPLEDPTVLFVGSDGVVLTRDLFFSGHTATMMFLVMTAVNRIARMVLVVGLVIVAAGVLVQHVHYSIDVFAAPFFAYGAHRLVLYLRGRVFGPPLPA